MADLPRETVIDGVTAIRADLVPPAPVQLDPESPRFHPFWLIAANVTGYPAFTPRSFDELVLHSDVRFVGKIVSLAPEIPERPEGTVGLIVAPEEGPIDGADEVRVAFPYP